MTKETRTKIRRALIMIVFLLRYTIKKRFSLLLWQIALSFGSTFLQGGVVVVLLAYARSLDGSGIPYAEDFILNMPQSEVLLYLLTTSLILLISSGFMSYWADRLVSRISVETEKDFSLGFISATLGSVREKHVLMFSDDLRKKTKILAQKRARGTGRTLRVLLGSIHFFIKTIVFSAVCLFVAPKIALVIVGFAVLALIWQYSISRKIYSNQARREKLQSKVSKQVNSWIDESESCPLSSTIIDDLIIHKYHGSYFEEAHKAFEYHINVPVRSNLIGHFLMTFGVITGLGLIADGYMKGEYLMPNVIAFFYAALLALGSSKALFVQIGAFSRLYIHLRETLEFFRGGDVSYIIEKATNYIRTYPVHGYLDVRDECREIAVVGLIPLTRISSSFYLEPLYGARYTKLSRVVLTHAPSLIKGLGFEQLTGYATPSILCEAGKTQPLASLGWNAWYELCEIYNVDMDNALSLSIIESVANRNPLVSLLAVSGLDKNPPNIILISSELLDSNPQLIQILKEGLQDSNLVTIYNERSLPLNLPDTLQAVVVGSNGICLQTKVKSVKSVNENIDRIRKKFDEQWVDVNLQKRIKQVSLLDDDDNE